MRVSQSFAFDAAAIWHRLASLSTFSVWLYGVIPFLKEFPGGQNICWKGLTSVWCLWCHLPRWYAVIPGRTWLTWTFPTSSLSLKAKEPQVYLQPLGSNQGDTAILTGKAVPDLTLSFCDSAVSVVQSQPGAGHCRSESVGKLDLLEDRPAAWCHTEPLLAIRRHCLWSSHDKEQC